MEPIEMIKDLCSKSGITIAQLEKELGYSNGSLSKSKTIKAERLMEIARRFNVTMEFLMTGGSQPDSYYLDPEVAEMAQEMATRPELKVLFSASRKVSKETLEAINNMIEQMRKDYD